MENSNGHHPERILGRTAYSQERDADQPEEIAAFARATDPYANMLPGVSNIRAAETFGREMESGKRGNRMLMVTSILMLLALLLPFILNVINQLGHH